MKSWEKLLHDCKYLQQQFLSKTIKVPDIKSKEEPSLLTSLFDKI